MSVDKFIEESNSVSSVAELTGLFRAAIAQYGFEHFALTAVNGPLAPSPSSSRPALEISYPGEWIEHYFSHGYVEIDPVVTRSRSIGRPYTWDSLRDLTPVQQRMFNEGREFGVLSGVSVPIHGPGNELFIAGLAAKCVEVASAPCLPYLHALVGQFYVVARDLSAPAPLQSLPVLSQRERECLKWSAVGKSSWDIGGIMSISEHTVNFHLRNAMSKLDASNRILAVVKAIRLGLIEP